MGYVTSVRKTWGPAWLLFLKIYGFCVQGKRLVTTVVSTPPQCVPPQRPQKEADAPALTAIRTLRGGRRLCSLRQRAPPQRMSHVVSPHFVSTSSPIHPPPPDSSQPPIPTAGRAQASTDQSSQLRNGPVKTEGASLQNNSFSHLKSCSPYSPGSGEKVNMDIFLSSDLSCLSLTTSTTTPAKTQKQTVAINFKTQEPRTHLTKR